MDEFERSIWVRILHSAHRTSSTQRTNSDVRARPEDVSESRPGTVRPANSIASAEPLYAVDTWPGFEIDDRNTTLILASQRQLPIRLSNALSTSPRSTIAQYPFIFKETEAFITPLSLKFTHNGSHFLAGGHSRLGFFDVSRPYQDPVEIINTGPARRKRAQPGTIKGLVSALSMTSGGLLAVGMYTRRIGIYQTGQRAAVTTFDLQGHEKSDDGCTDVGGSGVSQCSWSPCERYLYLAERNSDGLLVYDIRMTGRRIGILTGRKGRTFQRMAFEVDGQEDNHEVWAGGTDGHVRVWVRPHLHLGVIEPDRAWLAHNDTITSTTRRPHREIVATSAGSRHLSSCLANASFDGDVSDESCSRGISSSDASETSTGATIQMPVSRYDYSVKLWTH